jgi:hypothetical protein
MRTQPVQEGAHDSQRLRVAGRSAAGVQRVGFFAGRLRGPLSLNGHVG